MNQKKFYHQSVEICKICGKEIDTSKNEWAAVIDYNGKKQIRIGFYHRKCLNDLLKGKMEVMKQKFKEKLSQFTKDFFSGNEN